MKTHANIKVVREELPFDQLFQQIEVRLPSGTSTPDVFDVDAPVTAAYAVQGFLAPLDSVTAKPTSRNSYLPLWLQATIWVTCWRRR